MSNKPNIYDIQLHRLSLDMARIFVGMYNVSLDRDKQEQMLEAIKIVRRLISEDKNGDRHGAKEYHKVISGEVL